MDALSETDLRFIVARLPRDPLYIIDGVETVDEHEVVA